MKRKVSKFWLEEPKRWEGESLVDYMKRVRVWIEYRDMKKRGKF